MWFPLGCFGGVRRECRVWLIGCVWCRSLSIDCVAVLILLSCDVLLLYES